MAECDLFFDELPVEATRDPERDFDRELDRDVRLPPTGDGRRDCCGGESVDDAAEDEEDEEGEDVFSDRDERSAPF